MSCKMSVKLSSILALVVVLTLSFIGLSGCAIAKPADRGNLPYYSAGNSVVMQKEIGSLEDEYRRGQGAVIVKLTGSPQYYEADVHLEPGSAEEKIFTQSGASSVEKNKYYTFEAEVIKVIDNRQLDQVNKITFKTNWIYAQNDPVYQYYKVNPDQEYLLLISYDREKDIYYYSYRAAFYVKDGRVYATNNAELIDQYSGKSTGEMTKVLGALKAS